MTADAGFFRVHLQSLDDFGQELQSQLDALRRPADRLATLSGQQLPLGDFAEANALADRHAGAIEQMTGLMRAVLAAVAFAGEVTNTVAASYQQFDQQAAAAYGGAATAGPTPTAVQVSVPAPATVTVAGPNLPPGLPVSVTQTPVQAVQYADPSQAPVAG